jgi:hypothetical protein
MMNLRTRGNRLADRELVLQLEATENVRRGAAKHCGRLHTRGTSPVLWSISSRGGRAHRPESRPVQRLVSKRPQDRVQPVAPSA